MRADTLVIIPAFNEATRIAAVIAGVRAVVPAADIVVIDDGSGDDTAAVARHAGAMVIRHPFNLGYGVTIQTGYKYALAKGCRFLVQIDGDGQHDPAGIPALLAPVSAGDADFVIGSRFLNGNSYRPPLLRRFGMLLFRSIVALVIRQPVTDCTSGFQAFNREVIGFFARDLFPCDYPDADVLISLHLAGFRIREVPVRMSAGAAGKSMHSGIKPVYYVFKMLLSIAVTLLRSHRLYRRRSSCR
ncbi:MAG: glycosyltransferase family 2 protein [Deltaproteobacteria bacterium]|nr:MAG: glycosyltransferase family 2 protein [Deltaproteobacteria bacterium]